MHAFENTYYLLRCLEAVGGSERSVDMLPKRDGMEKQSCLMEKPCLGIWILGSSLHPALDNYSQSA